MGCRNAIAVWACCAGLLLGACEAANDDAGGAGTGDTAWQPTGPVFDQPGGSAPTGPDAGSGLPSPQPPPTDTEPTTPTPDAGVDAGSDPLPELMPVDAGSLSQCPAAPAGADPQAVEALDYINTLRLAAGAGCTSMVATINSAAQNHCDYYAGNTGACTSNPHAEVMGCTGFTGATPGDRLKAAGYSSRGWSEVMAFLDDPQGAIDMWINSVWHRLPLLDPWTGELGYGHATRCDTVDFGNGASGVPNDIVVVYPYAQQTGVPTSFDGSREGPTPPAPATGWPSSSPITLYASGMQITEHTLLKDGDGTPLPHVWLTEADSSSLRRAVFMYGNAPFEANTTYRVRVVGTYAGGPLELEWTFTTGAARRF
jgi:uncharacterized protein YkwD